MKNGNKKILSIFLMLLMLCTFIGPVQPLADSTKKQVKITVLGTSDIHGAINGWTYEDNKDYGNSGLARVATIVKKLRKENSNTLVIDNGDTIQGTLLTDDLYNKDLSKPNPIMRVMNKIGYDAMTLGNHEFNFGLDLIKKIEKEANFPILSANTYLKGTEKHFVKPYIIKEYDDVKVGILGLTVPSIASWDGEKVASLEFKHMAEEAEKYVKILKEQENVDVIVATAHTGLDSRHEKDGGDAARLIAEKCPEIDVLLIGHDHLTVNENINGILVGAPKAGRGNEVVRFDLLIEKVNEKWKVENKSINIIELKGVAEDKDVLEVGQEFHNATLSFLKEVIGKASGDFHNEAEVKGIPEARIRDSAVMDIINEVQLKITGADVSSAALFKSTSNLPKGDLTYADIFDIYKFPNTMVAVEVTGKQLKDYMEWSASYFNTFNPGDLTISFNQNIRDYNYDMFAGIDYEIDISKPSGQRITKLKMNGKAVSEEQIIKLALNNYRLSGLQKLGLITNNAYFESDPISIRSYIKDYIKEKGTIDPKVDDNWKIVGYNWNENLRKIAIDAINNGTLSIPKSFDERTDNVRAITERDLISAGLHSEYSEIITVAHTNDTHSRIYDGKDTLGFAKIAYKIDELRDVIGRENVLVMDAGDTLHGQPVITTNRGAGVVQIMNTVGYDVMVPGNHDFNYGQERLVELSKSMDFKLVSANIVKKDGTTFLEPYTIKEVNGLRIGIFGLTTPQTTYQTHPKNVEGLVFENPVKIAEKMVEELERKTDLIIAVSHLGIHEGNYTSEEVAKKVKGIDLIVDGHSHTKLPQGKIVNKTVIVQTGEYDKSLGIVDILIKKDGTIKIKPQLFEAINDSSLLENQKVKKVIENIKNDFETIAAKKVGATDVRLVGDRGLVRTGETNMGNIITNAMLMETGADLALTNGGGIRASIEAGDIAKKDIIGVLPFGNYIVTLEVTGQEILDALEVGIDEYPKAKGSFPHIAGMTMKFDPELEAGKKVISVLVDGKPIQKNKKYVLATNDFIAAGGDNYVMFKDNPINGEYQALDEAVIEYIQRNGTKNIEIQGRVTTGKIESTEKVKGLASLKETNKDLVYIVKNGDNLGKIAYKHKTTYEELAKYNKIKNPNLIYVGQKILIPLK